MDIIITIRNVVFCNRWIMLSR